jgi:hypothetical protein
MHDGWNQVTGADCTVYPSDPSCLVGGLGLAGTPNAALAFDFTGTTLAMRYEVGPNQGRFQVAVDGRTPVVVDVYQPGQFTMATTAIASGLANTTHHAVASCVSGQCHIDDFPVTCQ